MEESRRGRRRRLTLKVAEKRRREYIDRMLHGEVREGSREATSPYYWAKVSVCCCDCRKRNKGAPRRSKGLCDIGARDRIYRSRARVREGQRLLSVGEHPDSDGVALLLDGRYVCDLW